MSFSSQLKKAMLERNISQVKLSQLTGIGKSSISQYISGKNVPKEEALEKIASVLDCSVEFLNATEADIDSGNSGMKNVPVAEAAKRLGIGRQSVRRALQNKSAAFGFAVWNPVNEFRPYSYHISERKLNEYIKGLKWKAI